MTPTVPITDEDLERVRNDKTQVESIIGKTIPLTTNPSTLDLPLDCKQSTAIRILSLLNRPILEEVQFSTGNGIRVSKYELTLFSASPTTIVIRAKKVLQSGIEADVSPRDIVRVVLKDSVLEINQEATVPPGLVSAIIDELNDVVFVVRTTDRSLKKISLDHYAGIIEGNANGEFTTPAVPTGIQFEDLRIDFPNPGQWKIERQANVISFSKRPENASATSIGLVLTNIGNQSNLPPTWKIDIDNMDQHYGLLKAPEQKQSDLVKAQEDKLQNENAKPKPDPNVIANIRDQLEKDTNKLNDAKATLNSWLDQYNQLRKLQLSVYLPNGIKLFDLSLSNLPERNQ